MMSCLKIIAIALLMCLGLYSISFAMASASCHAHLWRLYLPIEWNTTLNSLGKISSIMDKFITNDMVYTELAKDNFQIVSKLDKHFTFGFEGAIHRSLFHWGLTLNEYEIETSKDTEKLRNLLWNIRINRQTNLTDDEKNDLLKFYYTILGRYWSERKNNFVDAVKNINFDLGTIESEYGLPVILYEIHILADFLDKHILFFGDITNRIEIELIKNGILKLPQSPERDKLIKKIKAANAQGTSIDKNFLKRKDNNFPCNLYAVNNIPEDPVRQKALFTLLLLHEYLPTIISKSFGNRVSQDHQAGFGVFQKLQFWK